MRIPVLLVVVVLGLTVAAPSEASSRCFPRKATRITANDQARVYALHDPDVGKVVYGCHKRTGRTVWLGDNEDTGIDEHYIANIELNGVMVGFNDGCACREYNAEAPGVTVVDLRRGRRVHRAEFPITSSIDDVVVSPSGSAALIVTHAAPPSPPPKPSPDQRTREVRAIEGREVSGLSRVVDSGLGIAETSLTLDGFTLRWTHDGQRRKHRLAG